MSEVLEDIDEADELVPLHAQIAATLPKDWTLETLGSLCEKSQYGWTTKADKAGEGVKFLRTTDITPGVVDWTSVPYCVEAPRDLEKYLIKDGDVLISRTGSIGVNYLVVKPETAVFASYLIRFRPKTSISTKYLKYYLQSPAYWRAINTGKKGIAVQNVNATMLSRIPVPVAPQAVQNEIVAELEKQFSRLDEAVANLQRVKANLKRYKASVLKAAVEGRLVETEATLARREGRTYETGEQLLQRILEERRAKWTGKGKYKEPVQPATADLPALPEGWTWATMPQLGELNRGKSKHRPRDDQSLYGGPYPFIQTGDVRRSDSSITEFTQTYSEVGLAQSRLWPPGTLCITIAANIAETGILKLKACFPDSIVGFIPYLGSPTVEYVESFIRTARDGLDRFASATAQKNINLEVLESVAVPTPPLAELIRIVAEIDRHLSVIREVEAEVDTNLQCAQALRQSVLQRAFSGDLLAGKNQLTAARNAGSVEPVSVVIASLLIAANYDQPTFGRVKLQKLLYLAIHHAQVEAANEEFERQQAGPLDMPMLLGVIKRVGDLGWFRETARAGKSPGEKIYSYAALTKADDFKQHLAVLTPEQLSTIRDLNKLMRNWPLPDCELFSTVYAAWNDLILWKYEPTDAAITEQVRENWTESKKRFSPAAIAEMVKTIKGLGYEPKGFGRPTTGQAADTQSGALF